MAGLHVAAPIPSTPFRLGCGSGPPITVSGQVYQFVNGTLGDLIGLQPVKLGLCTPGGGLTLAAGRQMLAAEPLGGTHHHRPRAEHSAGSFGGGRQPEDQGPGLALRQEDSPNRPRRGFLPRDSRELQCRLVRDAQRTQADTDNAGRVAAGLPQSVPAGQGGAIDLVYQPTTIYHVGIIASAVALLLMLGVATTGPLRRRRAATDPSEKHAKPGSPTINFELMAQPTLVFSPSLEPGAHAAELQRPAAEARGLFEPLRPNAGGSAPDAGLHALASAATHIAMVVPLTAVIFIAGGPIALAVPVIAVIDGWRPGWRPAIALCAMLAAGLTAATARTPTSPGSGPFSGTAQVFALVALAVALAAGRRRDARLAAGRSAPKQAAAACLHRAR